MDDYYELKDRVSCYIIGSFAFVGLVVTLIGAVIFTVLK